MSKIVESTKSIGSSFNEKASEVESGYTSSTVDHDAKRLEQLGYKQEFKREISLFVQAGFSFSTMAVLPNWLVGFSATMSAGGPMSLFWGYIVVAPFIMCIALSMAEVFSAYPVNGGVYSWCYLLSNKEYGPVMSWVCGYLIVGGFLSAMMTLAYTMSNYVIAVANIFNEEKISNPGVNVGLYILFLLLGVGYSYLGLKFSAFLNKFMVIWVVIGTMIVIIVMPVMAPSHPSAAWVFTEFQNSTGYQNSGLAFFLGLLQAGWTLLGYEVGAHISEGTKNADTTGPRGIIIAVVGAIVQGIVICIATLFSIQDPQELQESSFPLSTLFVQATNEAIAAFFMVILIVTQFGSLCNTFLATAQLLWSMARDQCIPYHQFWYQLSGKDKVPFRILMLELAIGVLVILPSLASEEYWSAIMSTAVICCNVAYVLPYLCRLIWKRHDMEKGPFNLGRWSVPVNIVAVLWIAFFSVILCIPSVNPVSPVTMNWSSLMIGAILIFSLVFWFISGRKNFKGPMQTLGAK